MVSARDDARRERERLIDQIADQYLEDDWSIVEDTVCADDRRVVMASNEEAFRRGGREMYSVILFTPDGADVSHFFLPSRTAAETIFRSLVQPVRARR